MASDNKPLGQFNLEGIPAAPRGVPQIEVTFDIDANGIVKVSAKDKATGKEQAISIKASGGLEENEIEKMVKDAELYAEDDKKRRETVETRNQAEALTHTAEKTLSDLGDKAESALRTEVESAVSDVKSALEGDDEALIKEKTEALSTVMMKLGEAAYSTEPSNASEDHTAEQGGGAAEDDVVDADFEEIDDSSEENEEDIKKAN